MSIPAPSVTARVRARVQPPELAPVTDIGTAAASADLSFEQFFADHHERLTRALAVTLNDSELAADAANEAMVRAYKNWSKISQYDQPGAWVYRVGLNWSLSWRRRRRRERTGQVPEQAASIELRDDSFDAAIDQLSVDHRAVIACRIYLDWSVEQTAEALDLAPGTVKSRLARALAHLRTAAESEEAE